METFTRFLYEFLSQFFSGLIMVVQAIWAGVKSMLNIPEYVRIVQEYKSDLTLIEWLLVATVIIILTILVICIVSLIIMVAKKYINIIRRDGDREQLIKELKSEVMQLTKEKEEFFGLYGGTSMPINGESRKNNGNEEEELDDGIRFGKLCQVDNDYENYRIRNYGNNFTLKELCDNFRNFAASKLNLYYDINLIRLFISALASTKLVILQGISGTGKTSLAYAWGKFLKVDSCVVSVQPSWRDRTELFGYFNEFTKKFNETELLKELYEANYTDDIYTIILDEMNIARVEYYFAEVLSILEMPNPNEWVVELVTARGKNDPKRIVDGKLKLPENAWYIGTINNDDSTFMVTDKVYDRAMPIDINDKGRYFEGEDVDAMDINFSYLNELFKETINNNTVSDDLLQKIELMDNYVIKHFKIAFGNRIVAHLKKFVPVYVACGGNEIDAVDYFMAKKVLRKFEQLNIAYIKSEINPFIDFLNKTFGKNKMKECIETVSKYNKL